MILATNFCEETVNAWKIIGITLYVLKILVPLVVIITGTIPFINAVTKGTMEEVTNAAKKLFFKLVAALIVFLAPVIIPSIIELITGNGIDSDMHICTTCIKSPNGGECNAKAAYDPEELDFDSPTLEGNFDTGDLNESSTKEESGTSNGSIKGVNAKGNVEQLLIEAKKITDYVRENGFNYGDAPLNPAINHDAKLVSCDRCVGWFLYNIGYTDQPEQSGLALGALQSYLDSHGFTKITNENDIQAGDIMFINPSDDGTPSHTYLLGNPIGNGIWERYDCGSVYRIRLTEQYSGYSSQPFQESIGTFMYAYRMPTK